MRIGLIAAFFLALSSLTSHGVTHFVWPLPPKPPACAAKDSCDRDPEHLSAYASAFYTWLISSRAALDKALPSTEATAKARDAAFEAENRHLQGALTKSFYKAYDKQMSASDGDNSAPNCQDHDSQVLLCLFDYPDAWLGDVQASVKAIAADKATLTVNLPKYNYAEAPSKDVKVGEARTITVTLVLDKGVWKFDKVTDLAK